MKSMLVCCYRSNESLLISAVCGKGERGAKANANVVVSQSDVAVRVSSVRYIVTRAAGCRILLSDGTQVRVTSRVQREVIATMKPERPFGLKVVVIRESSRGARCHH